MKMARWQRAIFVKAVLYLLIHYEGNADKAEPQVQHGLANGLLQDYNGQDALHKTVSHQGKDNDVLSAEPKPFTSTSENKDFLINKSFKMPTFIKFVKLQQPLRHGQVISVDYDCVRPDWQVVVELRTYMSSMYNKLLFRHSWKCLEREGVLRTSIRLKLQRHLRYRPSILNPNSSYVDELYLIASVHESGTISAFLTDEHFRFHDHSTIRTLDSVTIVAPWERQRMPRGKMCLCWWVALQSLMPYRPQCALESVLFIGISYPVALSGHRTGVHRHIPAYHNQDLEKERIHRIESPSFTLSMWVYIVEYCLHGRALCSIVQRLTWDDLYTTPLIYINKKGQLHIQVVIVTGKAWSVLTPFSVPKHQWCRIILTARDKTWTVNTGCVRESLTETLQNNTHQFVMPSSTYFDEQQSLTIFGGSEVIPSFKGFIGNAVLHRTKALNTEQLAAGGQQHHLLELSLQSWDRRCQRYLTWVKRLVQACKQLLQFLIDQHSCLDPMNNVFFPATSSDPIHDPTTCPLFRGGIPIRYHLASKVISQTILDGKELNLAEVGRQLYENVTWEVEANGIHAVRKLFPLLRQASCYGNHDATFMLSTILNNGITIKMDEKQAFSSLMYGALDGHRLCLLALGNKHSKGLDGVPYDLEQAYVYYKDVAEVTSQDRVQHKKTDVYTQHIRLTDEVGIKAQTDEDDDVFLWFKHQAKQGVLSAQHHMARMLFWGSQGITRNTESAVDYYRQSALSEDSAAMFDYGLVLLRGQGTKKNVTEGLMWVRRAADKGLARAINTLGWHALEQEGNISKAVLLFEEAYKKGDPDAAHNLGYLWQMGKYPGNPMDRLKALEYFAFGALHQQMDSAIMVALYNMRGTSRGPRSQRLAVEWVRFVGEQNPALGKILRQALKAYRNQNWPAALLYYHMAAETGLEVGTFNAAYLCEENKEELVSYIEKECMHRYYNLSTQHDLRQVHSYSLVKMGDYFWYRGKQETKQAARMYSKAAKKSNPQALFNLAFLVEQDVTLPQDVLNDLRITRAAREDKVTLLSELYTRCKDSKAGEAFLPCSLALLRVQATDVWEKFNAPLKCCGVLGSMLALLLTVVSLYCCLKTNQVFINTV